MLLKVTSVAVTAALVHILIIQLFSQDKWNSDNLFVLLDNNHDNSLDTQEFSQIFHVVWNNALGKLKPVTFRQDDSYVVRSYFLPLQLNSLDNNIFESTVTVKGLLDWKKAHKLQEIFTASEFSTLLPPPTAYKGEVWYLVNPAEGEEYAENLSSNRHYEEGPFSGSEIVIRKLLSVFHPNVFIQTRFKPRGCLTITQAETNNLISVLLRCHAEFQLNEPPLKPFWFTPAKFEGQIILFKDTGKPLYLSLEVPNSNHVNVDMEWISSEHSVHVDIGYMPLMKLQLLAEDWDPSTERWTNISSIETGFKILERKMLPFKQVEYHKFPEALVLSRKKQMPMHCVVLWGALDDQSC